MRRSPATETSASRLSLSRSIALRWPAAVPGYLRVALLITGAVAILIVAAKIKVPFYPVPMTLQTLAIGLIAATLGMRLSVQAVVSYIALGAIGLPVFTNTPPSVAGLLYFMGPTGGYLAGFVISALIVSFLCERGWDRSFGKLWTAMFLGDAAIIGLGVLWLAFGGPALGLDKALAVGLAPFVLSALLKEVLGAALIRATSSALERRLNVGL